MASMYANQSLEELYCTFRDQNIFMSILRISKKTTHKQKSGQLKCKLKLLVSRQCIKWLFFTDIEDYARTGVKI